MKWKQLSRKSIIKNHWMQVHKDTIQLPSHIVVNDFYVIDMPDAAAVVALDTDNNIILKEEYRYPVGETLIEIPAGGFEADEIDGLQVAKRELLEETGYVSEEWVYLGSTVENPSKCSNHLHLYLAKNCVKRAEQNLDTNEIINVRIVSLSDAVEMVMRNDITVNSSVHGILKVARMMHL